MTDIFKQKHKDKTVKFLGTCEFYDIEDKSGIDLCDSDKEFDAVFDGETNKFLTHYVYTRYTCVQCRDLKSGCIQVIPLLTFLNLFEPVTKPAEDFISVMDKIIDKENEGHTENICSLHSGEPKADNK